MNVWHLVLREISHRKLNFALGLLSIAVAVGCLVGALTLLRADEVRTAEILETQRSQSEQQIAQRKADVEQAGAELQDAMRKITKGLGFNILILPEQQDLSELHVEGTLSSTMPEEYVDRLANSRIVTVNHLLPMVMQKIRWDEQDRTVILVGTRGEVPFLHRDPKKPLLDQVPKGSIVLGYQVHQQLELSTGDEVTLLGKQFTVSDTYEERGTSDDGTVWINLAEAQHLLGKQNLVHAILALECNCAAQDRIGQIREEIAGVLPGTQIIERGPPALARAEARNKAQQSAVTALEQEQAAAENTMQRLEAEQAAIRGQHEGFAAVLVPLVLVGCAVWIGFLTFGNVRQRNGEIAILRAVGLRSSQIFSIFLGKSLLAGLAGAVLGYAAGFAIGTAWGGLPSEPSPYRELFTPELLLLALIAAPLLAAVASWIPAMLAARQDPALVLQEE